MDINVKNFVKTVKKNSYYNCYIKGDKPIIVYEDHRFIFPILWLAKKYNLIAYPINLIYFDNHHDALINVKIEEIIEHIKHANDFDKVFEIVEKELHMLDDDWLRFLMNLEIVKDAVLFSEGVSSMDFEKLEKYKDSKGSEHLLKNVYSLEGAFNHQAALANYAQADAFKPIWDIIGWQFNTKSIFSMRKDAILVDFDLDYFTFDWRSGRYAWRTDFYKQEFEIISEHFTTKGWSGGKFLDELIQRTPFITIAREPRHCGGIEESDSILKQLNGRFFNNAIK